jgi:hypothetical protein
MKTVLEEIEQLGRTEEVKRSKVQEEETKKEIKEETKKEIKKEIKEETKEELEEKFTILSKNKHIPYLTKHESSIRLIFNSLSSVISSYSIFMLTSITSVMNTMVNTDLGKDIIEKIIWRVLLYRQWGARMEEQFKFKYSGLNIDANWCNDIKETCSSIYKTKMKEYILELEKNS